jgi:hypothetical protein
MRRKERRKERTRKRKRKNCLGLGSIPLNSKNQRHSRTRIHEISPATPPEPKTQIRLPAQNRSYQEITRTENESRMTTKRELTTLHPHSHHCRQKPHSANPPPSENESPEDLTFQKMTSHNHLPNNLSNRNKSHHTHSPTAHKMRRCLLIQYSQTCTHHVLNNLTLCNSCSSSHTHQTHSSPTLRKWN